MSEEETLSDRLFYTRQVYDLIDEYELEGRVPDPCVSESIDLFIRLVKPIANLDAFAIPLNPGNDAESSLDQILAIERQGREGSIEQVKVCVRQSAQQWPDAWQAVIFSWIQQQWDHSLEHKKAELIAQFVISSEQLVKPVFQRKHSLLSIDKDAIEAALSQCAESFVGKHSLLNRTVKQLAKKWQAEDDEPDEDLETSLFNFLNDDVFKPSREISAVDERWKIQLLRTFVTNMIEQTMKGPLDRDRCQEDIQKLVDNCEAKWGKSDESGKLAFLDKLRDDAREVLGACLAAQRLSTAIIQESKDLLLVHAQADAKEAAVHESSMPTMKSLMANAEKMLSSYHRLLRRWCTELELEWKAATTAQATEDAFTLQSVAKSQEKQLSQLLQWVQKFNHRDSQAILPGIFKVYPEYLEWLLSSSDSGGAGFLQYLSQPIQSLCTQELPEIMQAVDSQLGGIVALEFLEIDMPDLSGSQESDAFLELIESEFYDDLSEDIPLLDWEELNAEDSEDLDPDISQWIKDFDPKKVPKSDSDIDVKVNKVHKEDKSGVMLDMPPMDDRRDIIMEKFDLPTQSQFESRITDAVDLPQIDESNLD